MLKVETFANTAKNQTTYLKSVCTQQAYTNTVLPRTQLYKLYKVLMGAIMLLLKMCFILHVKITLDVNIGNLSCCYGCFKQNIDASELK